MIPSSSLILFLFSLLSIVSANHFSRRDHNSLAHRSAFLYYHNEVRKTHYAADLSWSVDLANMAKQWSDECNMAHTDGSLGGGDVAYGELMYAQTGDPTAGDIVNAFVSDAADFNYSLPILNHFTQVVWKNTTQVGCSVTKCSNFFEGFSDAASFAVCFYSPPGNVIGAARENVSP